MEDAETPFLPFPCQLTPWRLLRQAGNKGRDQVGGCRYPLVTWSVEMTPLSTEFPQCSTTHRTSPRGPTGAWSSAKSMPRASPRSQALLLCSAPVLTSPHGPHALTPEAQPAVQALCPSSRCLSRHNGACPHSLPSSGFFPASSPCPPVQDGGSSPHLGPPWVSSGAVPSRLGRRCCFLVTDETETWEVGSDSAGPTPTCPKPGHSCPPETPMAQEPQAKGAGLCSLMGLLRGLGFLQK